MNDGAVNRIELIKNWLKIQLNARIKLEPASSDASFRRYFRVYSDKETFILMDAPADKEPIKPFLSIGGKLLKADINVPKIISFNEKLGFILMGDLGKHTYLDKLNNDNVSLLYGDAINVLIRMQKRIDASQMINYSNKMLFDEMSLVLPWYFYTYKSVKFKQKINDNLKETFKLISDKISVQTKFFVHRDYHSRNLMYFNEQDKNPGILDFQDAVLGPISYDLVSLLKDAYVKWDEEIIIDQSIRYWEKAKKTKLINGSDFADFYEDFEWVGVQRHLKILGIFSRLYIRDNKDQYLKYIPLVEDYLIKTTERYKELHLLRKILDVVISKA